VSCCRVVLLCSVVSCSVVLCSGVVVLCFGVCVVEG
jgi:hypothetical protein